MSQIYITEPDVSMANLAKQAFGYEGKKFSIRTATDYQLSNYWDGGSRTQSVLVEREGLKLHFPKQGTTNPWNIEAHARFEIPKGVFILEHRIFRGKDQGITFVVRPDEMDTAMLPTKPALTEDEEIVLLFTKTLKSSYNGISNYRFHSAQRARGITLERWEAAKQSCIAKKLLNRQGAITQEGRNAVADKFIH